MIDPDASGWISHHAHVLLAGTANGVAWAQSINTGNLSVGTVVTVCTIAVPAVGGAAIYIIKTVGPVWLKFAADRDAMRSSTMAGQMERLNRNLEQEREIGASKAELAKQLKSVADLATQRAEMASMHSDELAGMVKALTAKVDEGNRQAATAAGRIEDINAKLHRANNALQVAENRARLAELDVQDIQAKLDEALSRLNANTAKFEDNTAKLDQVSAKVAVITEFGAAVANAADALVHPPGTAPETGHGTDPGSSG